MIFRQYQELLLFFLAPWSGVNPHVVPVFIAKAAFFPGLLVVKVFICKPLPFNVWGIFILVALGEGSAEKETEKEETDRHTERGTHTQRHRQTEGEIERDRERPRKGNQK